MNIKPKCDMLLDQNRTVDGDPVGHCCMNDATHSSGEYLICPECARLLTEEPERVTIPARGTARTWKDDANRYIKEAMKCVSLLLLLASTATALPTHEEAAIVAAVERNVPDATLRPDFVRLLRAIRLAESGRPGREFGIMSARANDLGSQAGWAAATVYKVWLRWSAGVQGVGVPYLVALRDQYAPIGADNDPDGLNENWLHNVVAFLEEER